MYVVYGNDSKKVWLTGVYETETEAMGCTFPKKDSDSYHFVDLAHLELPAYMIWTPDDLIRKPDFFNAEECAQELVEVQPDQHNYHHYRTVYRIDKYTDPDFPGDDIIHHYVCLQVGNALLKLNELRGFSALWN